MLLRNLDQSNGLNNGSRIIDYLTHWPESHCRTFAGWEPRWRTPNYHSHSLDKPGRGVGIHANPPTISNTVVFCYDRQQVTGSIIEKRWLGLAKSCFHSWAVVCGAVANNQCQQSYSIVTGPCQGKDSQIVYPEVLQHMRENRDVADFVAGLEAGGDIDMIDI